MDTDLLVESVGPANYIHSFKLRALKILRFRVGHILDTEYLSHGYHTRGIDLKGDFLPHTATGRAAITNNSKNFPTYFLIYRIESHFRNSLPRCLGQSLRNTRGGTGGRQEKERTSACRALRAPRNCFMPL